MIKLIKIFLENITRAVDYIAFLNWTLPIQWTGRDANPTIPFLIKITTSFNHPCPSVFIRDNFTIQTVTKKKQMNFRIDFPKYSIIQNRN